MMSSTDLIRVLVEFSDPQPNENRARIMLRAAGMREANRFGDAYWSGVVHNDGSILSLYKINGVKNVLLTDPPLSDK